jgi:putative tryptophan/tyrosine transport system substrate-binding protein
MRGTSMRRRDYITLIGGAAASWPLAGHAQQPGRRRIGMLMGFAESDPEAQSWLAAFREELRKLGWTDGRNTEMEIRWAAGDVESMKRFAKELVSLQP